MHVSMMDVSMILDPDTCMYDAYIYPDTHEYDAHMYDAFIHDDWSWYMHVWCIYLCSSILDSDACMYDAYVICIYDSWIYDAIFFGDERTDEQGDSRSLMWIKTSKSNKEKKLVIGKKIVVKGFKAKSFQVLRPCRDQQQHSIILNIFGNLIFL